MQKMKMLKFCIVIIFYVFIFSSSSFAQSPTSQLMLSPTETLKGTEPSPSPIVEKVNYELPYPGMLPDNPLYFLKGIRDKIIEILISDPVKKGEFYLLSSDKRLNSGFYLIEKGKDEMGVLYVSKSNNYMHMAASELLKTKEKGKDMLSTVLTSIKKHREVINDLTGKVDKKYLSQLKNEIERLNQIEMLIVGKKQ